MSGTVQVTGDKETKHNFKNLCLCKFIFQCMGAGENKQVKYITNQLVRNVV